MLQVDLSTLSAPELRRLLDAARGRGQASQTYQILQEMEARRQRQDRQSRRPRFARRRDPSDQRVIGLDLGDPLERDDETLPLPAQFSAPAEAAAEPEPAAPFQLDLERTPRTASHRAPWVAAAFVVGAALGSAGGWWVGTNGAPAVPAPAHAAPATAPMAVESAPAPLPPAAVVAEAQPAAESPAEVAAASSAPHVGPPVETGDVASPDAPAAEPAELAQPSPAPGCAAAPTPADRAICADPELQALQAELRQAYAEALAAHRDRALLRQRQLAWAESRKTVADAERLSQLYRERIRKLQAATAQARGL